MAIKRPHPGFVWVMARPDDGGACVSKATLAPCVTRNGTAGCRASRRRGEWSAERPARMFDDRLRRGAATH